MASKHDNKVKKVANNYKKRGFSVLADVSGFKKPKVVGGRRADVVAIKGGNKVLVEIETGKSMGLDKKQRQDFRNIAKKSGYKFRTTKTR